MASSSLQMKDALVQFTVGIHLTFLVRMYAGNTYVLHLSVLVLCRGAVPVYRNRQRNVPASYMRLRTTAGQVCPSIGESCKACYRQQGTFRAANLQRKQTNRLCPTAFDAQQISQK